MLVELVERLGHTFDWWLDQPLAFLRYCYLHLQEIDRRRRWEDQMGKIDQAWFNARGFHMPDTLADEQTKLIESAASSEALEAVHTRGLMMLAELENGRVLDGIAENLEYVH